MSMERIAKIPAALTIAGSDSIGGAGIQADIKTMTVFGVYAMSAVTAVTAQNTMGVSAVEVISPETVTAQIQAVFEDIVPDAVKIGMLASAANVRAVSDALIKYGAKNTVLDPVMVSTSGKRLLDEDAVAVLKSRLFPLCRVITPNIPEACALTGLSVSSVEDMERAGKILLGFGPESVLIKGGHMKGACADVLVSAEKTVVITGERIANPNNHGTGCTLSSAIASCLAVGADTEQSVRKAKAYITKILQKGLDIGKGSGPMKHF